MYVLLFLAVLGAARGASVNRHMRLLNDNHIDSLKPSPQTKRFITITKRPVPRVHSTGVELTCEAIAAPAPSIHWFRNNAPVYEYDRESNEVIDTNPSSLGRVSSTLLPRDPGVYTCLVLSGDRTARASTTVHDIATPEPTERIKLQPLSPRILVSYKVYVDIIGTNVVLPCRARGHPRPVVTWVDNNGNTVKDDSRMKVLRSGELVISGLRWSDMGEWSCRADNVFGAARANTFVYPARPNDTDG